RHDSTGTVAAFASVLVLLVAALFESPFQHAETWALLWLWMSVPVASEEKLTEAQPDAARLKLPIRVLRWSGAVVVALAAADVAVQPAIASHWTATGERWEDQHNYSEAVAAYQRALSHDVTSANAHFNLTRSL